MFFKPHIYTQVAHIYAPSALHPLTCIFPFHIPSPFSLLASLSISSPTSPLHNLSHCWCHYLNVSLLWPLSNRMRCGFQYLKSPSRRSLFNNLWHCWLHYKPEFSIYSFPLRWPCNNLLHCLVSSSRFQQVSQQRFAVLLHIVFKQEAATFSCHFKATPSYRGAHEKPDFTATAETPPGSRGH